MKWTERLGHDDIRPTPMNERSMNFFSTFTLWIAANVVITTVMTGMMFVPDISFSNAMLAIIVGSAIGAIPLALTGNIGIRTGLPTMVITRAAFGQKRSHPSRPCQHHHFNRLELDSSLYGWP